MGKIRLIELIDQTPAIKSKFKTENITMFSGYDMHTHKRTSGGMDFEMIYKDLEFQLWRDELCLELAQLKQDEFIIDLMKQLNGFSGWGDKERFQKIESKLQVLKGRIEEYIVELSPAIAEDKRIPEQMLIDKMTRALTKLQRNHNYNSSSSEDTMNDYVRDILDESYQIKDQTRQGESQKGDDAGEVDIQICVDGFPIVMIEALVLDSLKKQYLGDHINKVLTKYDPNGCPYAVIVIYATMARFDSFYSKFLEYLNQYEFLYFAKCDTLIVKMLKYEKAQNSAQNAANCGNLGGIFE